MTLNPLVIAPFQTGLDTDLEPWIAPPDSFSEIKNAHIHHSYVEKRAGYRTFAQMQGFTSTLAITGITNNNPAVVTVAAIGALVNGDYIYISGVTGMTEVNDGIYTVANIVGNTFELSGIDSTTYGVYAGAGSAFIIGDSADRVMGIGRFIQSDGTQTTLAFNTTKANRYDGVADQFFPLDAADIMSGSDTDFVWYTNWQSSDVVNRFYFTNGKAYDGASLDGIRYYDGTGNTTTSFLPYLDATPPAVGTRRLYGGKLLFVLKQRLIVLNTYEFDGANINNHPQRARWCQAQGPSNWNDIVAGGGGFIDAPTGDQIVSARSLQDQIIVFFTNSVWTLRPVPDPALPYRWDKINDFRACDGKMASIGYDRYAVAIGIRGITATDGTQTQRIDTRISDFTTDEINTTEFKKVFCERSYANLRGWTLFPAIAETENTAALISDDDSKAFSTYEIDMNCLGYGNFSKDYGLNDFIAANDLDINLLEAGDDGIQDYYWQDNGETLLGGDITGTVYIMEIDGDDASVDITSTMTTAQWNPFTQEGKEALLSYVDLYVDTNQKTILTIDFFKDDATDPYGSQKIDCLPNIVYICDIQDTSQTNPIVITAAQHGFTTGQEIYIYGILKKTDLVLTSIDTINGGLYTITVIDKNSFSLDGVDATALTDYSGGGKVYLNPFYKTKIWKRAYGGGIGYGHRIRVSSTGSDTPFKIHAFKPSFKPIGRRTIN